MEHFRDHNLTPKEPKNRKVTCAECGSAIDIDDAIIEEVNHNQTIFFCRDTDCQEQYHKRVDKED